VGLSPNGAQSARDDTAIAAIMDEVMRSLIPRKCFRDLTRNPFGRRRSSAGSYAKLGVDLRSPSQRARLPTPVASANQVLGNGQQGEDVTGYRGGGDEKPRHVVLSLSLTH
jgi:hypothetical protein